MNSNELVALVQKELGKDVSFAEAKRATQAVFGAVGKAITKEAKAIKKPKKGEPAVKARTVLQVPGVGSFKVGANPARKGRNPFNGETVNVRAKKKLSFRQSSTIKL